MTRHATQGHRDATSSAMIAAIERARGRDMRLPSARLLSISLLTVFFITLMGGLAAGATMYRAAVMAQTSANDLHLESGLISGVIRSGDIAGAVGRGEGPEGPALVLTRALSTRSYETRIYLYQGQVVQEFAVAGRPYDPANATPLIRSQYFDFVVGEGLVSFTTDAGTFDVALRSDPEAAQAGPQVLDAAEAGLAPEVETIIDDEAGTGAGEAPVAIETIADVVPWTIGGAR